MRDVKLCNVELTFFMEKYVNHLGFSLAIKHSPLQPQKQERYR
jgi:hypothetical protein